MQHSVVVLAGGYVLCATAFWATPRSHSGLEDILLGQDPSCSTSYSGSATGYWE